jgi:hypothetical protein
MRCLPSRVLSGLRCAILEGLGHSYVPARARGGIEAGRSRSTSATARHHAADTVGSRLSRPTILSTPSSTRQWAFTKAVPRTRAEPLRSPLSRLRAPIRLWPSSANVKPGCAPRRANDRHDISDLEFRRNQRLSVDELTIGRNSTFRNTTNAVAIAAHAPPARTPMAADHHRIASIETADVQAFPKNRARPAGTDTG